MLIMPIGPKWQSIFCSGNFECCVSPMLFLHLQECREHRVIDAKVFNNGPITGVAVLTGNYQFYVVSDVTQELARIRHLARISGEGFAW